MAQHSTSAAEGRRGRGGRGGEGEEGRRGERKGHKKRRGGEREFIIALYSRLVDL